MKLHQYILWLRILQGQELPYEDSSFNLESSPALSRSFHVDFRKPGIYEKAFDQTNTEYISNCPEHGFILKADSMSPETALSSNFYLMFGKLSVTCQTSFQTHYISEIALKSEINDGVGFTFMPNVSGKVDTWHNRRKTEPQLKVADLPNNADEYRTYTILWTAESIKWSVNNRVVRVVHFKDTSTTYPQTPMYVKISTKPYTMNPNSTTTEPNYFKIRSLAVENFSTGIKYQYTSTAESWKNVKAVRGSVGAKGRVTKHWFHNFAKLSKPI